MQVPDTLPGFQSWAGDDPYEDNAGPFYFREEPDGRMLSAFLCERKHLNGNQALHGGLLMTFADYALFVIAREYMDKPAVTISCSTEFLKGAAPIGDAVYADGEVTRATRSLIFVRGRIFTDAHELATFTGILKRLSGPDTGRQ